MSDPGDVHRLIQVMLEPVLVLEPDGQILHANPAARRLFGADAVGRRLPDLVEDGAAMLTFLGRCAGAATELPGGFTLSDATGARRRLRCHGALIEPADAGRAARVVMRCRTGAPEEFAILRRSIQDLNREIRLRQAALAELEAALRHRDLLLSELQHRMRNTTQMLLGMLATAQREGPGAEVVAFIAKLRARLLAIGAAQQVMYQFDRVDGISTDGFLSGLCRAIGQSWPDGARIVATADAAELRNDLAVPLALIVNELATNALKHGLRFGPGEVAVELRRDGAGLLLTVRDSGPGFGGAVPSDTAGGRNSGLVLVRALSRQIGGTLELLPGEGAVCRLRILGQAGQ